MKTKRVDVGRIRREQIVDAAIAVIAEQGIQHLSLSEIEKKTDMVRGQLTYYYKTKEDILLAVFDRLIELMHQRATAAGCPGSACHAMPAGWERASAFLSMLMLEPPTMPAFYPLQYTFLSQTSHRTDFRERLAKLYELWRTNMALDYAAALANKKGAARVSPRTLASLAQAILHGLAVQRAADPDAYDRQEMLALVLDLLGGYVTQAPAADTGKRPPRRNGKMKQHPAPKKVQSP